MAIQNQLVSIHIQGGDVTYKNYAAADIPSGLAVMIDTLAGSAQTSQDPPGCVLPTAAPSTIQAPLGVTMEIIKGTNAFAAGGKGRVQTMGAAVCTADGPIAYGQAVEMSNTAAKLGRVRLATGAAPQLGYCISQTAADGDPVLIWLAPGLSQRQSGSGLLAAGTLTVANVVLTANSVIIVSRKTQGGTVTSTVLYEAPSASRNVGAGTFVLQASVAAGTANAADTSIVDYLIIN